MTRDPDIIRYEDDIVWTEDLAKFDYVRVHLESQAGTRRKPVAWRGPGRRVGYSVLRPDAPAGDPPGRFVRRVFWIKEHDRSEEPNGVYKVEAPAEAVDPRTVSAGVWGELTARAWGAPLPEVSTSDAQPDKAKEGPPSKKSWAATSESMQVGHSSLAGGSATVSVAPLRDGRVEIYIDCASGTKLGNGTHNVAEVLPMPEARELLVQIVKGTPWLQEVLAVSVVDQWLSRGTRAPG